MFIKDFSDIETPDFTIVGSGPAGMTLALKLASYGKKSLIIEAGNLDFTEESQKFYEGQTFGQKYYDLSITRLRQFGGTSNHWGGSCWHLNKHDLRKWPIEFSDFDKYSKEAEKILNVKISNSRNLSDNFNSIPGENIINSDVNFAEKYATEIYKSDLIHVLLNTQLTKINNNNNIVESVTIANNGKKKDVFIKNLILSAGGIENSRILLWSREQSPGFLKDLPIGNNWMEHPKLYPGYFIPSKKYLKMFDDEFVTLEPKISMLEKFNTNNISFRLNLVENEKTTLKEVLRDFLCVAPKIGQNLIDTFYDYKTLNCVGLIFAITEQNPIFENQITLSKKNFDGNGIPKAILKWKLDNNWRNSVYKNLSILGEDFVKNNYGRIGIHKFIYDSSVKIPEKDMTFIQGNHHHMGGTPMGIDPITSVCNKNLKVHNVKNLYLLGSSVFPTGGWTYPTINIVKLSLRLAEHLNKKNS